jgi:hypothetical protein
MARNMTTPTRSVRFAICIIDDEPDLERGKIYKVLPDPKAERTRWIRVVDESSEDYLYPANCFVFVELPRQVQKAISAPVPVGARAKLVRRKPARKNA